ncbi:MAG: hypothetical protein APR54_08095 [Candidatus Cloacimonas sp. SDB]|nr:MAG: hypothetical protein APR54_08095 [Candidatus Cloacimonas sp. SDB]
MNEKLVGYLSSFLLHSLLAVILIMLVYSPRVDFFKIEIVEFGYRASANNENYFSPEASSPESAGFPDIGSDTNLIPDKVNLPKAVSDSNEPLYFPEKIETSYNNLNLDDDIGNRSIKKQLGDNLIAGEDLEISENPLLGESSEYLSSLAKKISMGESGNSPYILEGEITSRSIIKQIIPEYPENFQQNSRVKIRFEVLSDGSVDNMLIVEKSDPRLEEISLNAIKQWKFNALTSDAIQIGFITFIFQLK